MATVISTGIFRIDLLGPSGGNVLNGVLYYRAVCSQYCDADAGEFLKGPSSKTPADNTVDPLIAQIAHRMTRPVLVIAV